MRNRLFLVLTLTGLVVLAAAPAADSAPQTSSEFTIVASPTLPRQSSLTAVAAVSASDVWAIGSYWGGSRLMEYYNGSSWRVVAPPPLPHARLSSISAHGLALWVAGTCRVDTGEYGCVARYTGSRWMRVAVPTRFSYQLSFDAVLALSNTNVLVGGGEGTTQMIRWNGKTWSRVDDVPPHHYIRAIAGTLSTHLFAASYNVLEREQPDGSWLTTNMFMGRTYASDMSVSSAENVWVVGISYGVAGSTNAVAMRWNGTIETPIGVPGSPTPSDLAGVVTTRPDNTWAVGQSPTATGSDTLIEHYTGGSSFTELASPNTVGNYNRLFAIAAVPGHESELWVVGEGGNNRPLILHHS